MTYITEIESFSRVGYDQDAEPAVRTQLEIGMTSCSAAQAANNPAIRAITEALAADVLARPAPDGPFDMGLHGPAIPTQLLNSSPDFK